MCCAVSATSRQRREHAPGREPAEQRPRARPADAHEQRASGRSIDEDVVDAVERARELDGDRLAVVRSSPGTWKVSSRRWLPPTWTSVRYAAALPLAATAVTWGRPAARRRPGAGAPFRPRAPPGRTAPDRPRSAGMPGKRPVQRAEVARARSTDRLRAQRGVDLSAQLPAHDQVADERGEHDRDADGGGRGESRLYGAAARPDALSPREDVPDAADRVQQARLAAGLGLAAQVAHVDAERVRRRPEVVAPHVLEDLERVSTWRGWRMNSSSSRNSVFVSSISRSPRWTSWATGSSTRSA